MEKGLRWDLSFFYLNVKRQVIFPFGSIPRFKAVGPSFYPMPLISKNNAFASALIRVLWSVPIPIAIDLVLCPDPPRFPWHRFG